MRFSDLDQELNKQITEAPMGALKRGLHTVASKFGSQASAGKLDAGGIANQLKNEYEYYVGLHDDTKDEHSLDDFFKSKGLDTSVLPSLIRSYQTNTTPPTPDAAASNIKSAPAQKSSAFDVGKIGSTNNANMSALKQQQSAKSIQNAQNKQGIAAKNAQEKLKNQQPEQTSEPENIKVQDARQKQIDAKNRVQSQLDNPQSVPNTNNTTTPKTNQSSPSNNAPAVSNKSSPLYNFQQKQQYTPPFGYSQQKSDSKNADVIDLNPSDYTSSNNQKATSSTQNAIGRLPSNSKQQGLPKPTENPADRVIRLGRDPEDNVIHLGQDKSKKSKKSKTDTAVNNNKQASTKTAKPEKTTDNKTKSAKIKNNPNEKIPSVTPPSVTPPKKIIGPNDEYEWRDDLDDAENERREKSFNDRKADQEYKKWAAENLSKKENPTSSESVNLKYDYILNESLSNKQIDDIILKLTQYNLKKGLLTPTAPQPKSNQYKSSGSQSSIQPAIPSSAPSNDRLDTTDTNPNQSKKTNKYAASSNNQTQSSNPINDIKNMLDLSSINKTDLKSAFQKILNSPHITQLVNNSEHNSLQKLVSILKSL
jgi:hypothetical protein